jgi:hypothetical protein
MIMSRVLMVLMFLAVGVLSKAQLTFVSDDFNDGNISANPAWSGNTNGYSVSNTSPLEGAYSLTNTTSGSVPAISTQYGTNTNLSTANYNFTLLYRDNGASDPTVLNPWEDFTSNSVIHWRFYLAANSTNPNTTTGVCLEHSGNALKLTYRGGSGNGWEVASYTISRNTTYSIKVVAKSNGNWELYVDQGTGEATTLRGNQWPNLFLNGSQNIYMIFQSNATSGNAGRFIWDNAGLFAKSLSITQLTSGLATGDLEEGATNKAIFGFAATASGGTVKLKNVNISNTNSNSSGNFSNVKLFSSVDNDYSTSADNTQLTGVTINLYGTYFNITGIEQDIAKGTTKNYFLVTDIATGGGSSSIQLSMSCSSCGASNSNVYTENAETVNNFSFTGTNYNFVRVCIWKNTTAVGDFTDNWQSSNAWVNFAGPPTANDIVMFSSGGAATPLNIPAGSFKRIVIKNNTTVNITTTGLTNGSRTFTLTGGTGDDLEIEAGSVLNVTSTGNTLAIALNSGITGSVSGAVNFSGKAHTLTAASAGAITFQNGGSFTGGTGLTGNPFGSTTAGSVVFASGSTLEDQVGLDYFSANNVISLQVGSNYKHSTTTTASINNKTFGNLVLNTGATFTAGANTHTVNGSITGAGTLSLSSGTLNVSGDFSSTGTFTCTSCTINLNGTTQAVRSGTYTNLTISGSGTKSASGAITVSSSLTFNGGKFSIGANTLTLNGTVSGMTAARSLVGSATSNITIGGSGALGTLYFDQADTTSTNNINNLTINRTNLSGTVTLGNELRLRGTLTPTAGTLYTSDTLVLTSSATGSARILTINAANFAIVGKVSVERYFAAKTSRRWSFVSSAVAGETFRNAWQDDMFITGTGTGGTICATDNTRYNSNGFDASTSNTPTVYTYDQSTSARWVALPNTTATNVEKGKGYRMLIRGNRNVSNACTDQLTSSNPPAPVATVIKVKGTLTTGNVPVTISAKTTGTYGYTLIGNPYACEVDFSSFYTANSSVISNKYWTYDPGSDNTNYLTYSMGVVAGNRPSNIITNANGSRIASGQAFFVESINGGTATFTEAHKTSSAQAGVFRSNSVQKLIRTSFEQQGGTSIDNMVIRFSDDPAVTLAENRDWDAATLNTGNFVAGIKGNRSFAIQTRPLTFYDDTVMVRIVSSSTGNFRLSFSEYDNFTEAAQIILLDLFTGTQTDVKANPIYNFSITNDASTQGGRFKLVFRSSTSVMPLSFLGIAASKKDKSVEVKWNLAFEQDVQQYVVERSGDGRSFSSIASVSSKGNSNVPVSYMFTDVQPLTGSSYYRIRAVEKNGTEKLSSIVQVDVKNTSEIMVYPNPAKDVLNLRLPATSSSATYNLVIRNSFGATVLQQRLSNSTNMINVSALAAGVYYFTVAEADGILHTGKFLKQ